MAKQADEFFQMEGLHKTVEQGSENALVGRLNACQLRCGLKYVDCSVSPSLLRKNGVLLNELASNNRSQLQLCLIVSLRALATWATFCRQNFLVNQTLSANQA